MRTFYVTTPIYYVNDAPHVGHAYTTIVADTFARWRRMNGDRVRFCTGTDEHGQKVLRAAQKLGRTPQEHADLLHVRFKDLFTRLGVQWDDFIRTTEPRHQATVRLLLQRLYDQGEIYASDYAGWYSTSAERFWSDEEVAAAAGVTVEDLRAGRAQGVCPDSGGPVEWIVERNWFFRMSAYQERLVEHIHAHPGCIQPEWRRNEVLGYLRKPLGDLCISRPRARLPWGIPLPFDEDYVCYVWFDALTNYLSSLGYGTEASLFDTFWPEAVHLLGKDILTFHTVYWFSMLMACGIAPPKQVQSHGWWLMAGRKMSKSVGNVIDPDALVAAYGPDAVRYFLLREIPLGHDGEFSQEGFLLRYNSDLANDLGNLAHRALSMTEKWLGGVVPAAGPLHGSDAELVAVADRACAGFAAAMEAWQPRQALESLWELVRQGNKYIDTEQPWRLNKEGDTARLAAVLRNALEVCRIAAIHLAPVCPGKAAELLDRLGGAALSVDRRFDGLTTGAPVAARDPLFPRFLELPPGLAAPAAPAEPPPAPVQKLETPMSEPVAPTPLPPEITYDDFAKVALRVGRVLAAERHPNADRLLVLKVDVGEPEPRTIVAGIAAVYAPEEMVGRQIIVVANLKPAKLRGVTSQGMLLAAGGGDIAALLAPNQELPPGTVVK